MIELVTPFRIPADPVVAAELTSAFWQMVAMPQAGAERACWVFTKGRLFEFQLGRRRWTTTHARAAWTLVHGEVLHDVDRVMHACGNRRCVRPDHVRVYRRGDLAAAALEL